MTRHGAYFILLCGLMGTTMGVFYKMSYNDVPDRCRSLILPVSSNRSRIPSVDDFEIAGYPVLNISLNYQEPFFWRR